MKKAADGLGPYPVRIFVYFAHKRFEVECEEKDEVRHCTMNSSSIIIKT